MNKYKVLWDISEAGPIIRRYFVMNFFDGVLTALGIVLGALVTHLNGTPVSSTFVITTCLFTAIGIGISGLTGSHLAETAERRLNVIEMKKVLGLIDKDGKERHSKDTDKKKFSEADINKALGRFQKSTSTSIKDGPNAKTAVTTTTQEKKKKEKEKKKKHTLYEEAQEFAARMAAVVDGLSPFAGVMVVVIPFMFLQDNVTNNVFIICFILTGIVLFLLGTYLANISKDSILKYGMQMVLAAVLTSIISLGLGQLARNN